LIGFLGGTGPEGRGLALRLALAGEAVFIGSRDEARAAAAAQKIVSKVGGVLIESGTNLAAAERADTVFVTVPYLAQRETLEAVRCPLAGKIVVNTVSPLTVVAGVTRALPVPDGSAALEAQSVLPESSVVAAFHTLSAWLLLRPDRDLDCDVVVCGDDHDARAKIMALADRIAGVRAVDGGGLVHAAHLENFVALMLDVNRRYKAHSSLRLTGL